MLLRKSRGPPAFGFFARRSHPTFAATALGGLLVAASTGSALSHGLHGPMSLRMTSGLARFGMQMCSFRNKRQNNVAGSTAVGSEIVHGRRRKSSQH